MPLRHRHQFNQGVRPMNLKGSIGRSCRKLTDNPTIFRDKLDTFFMTGEQFEVARADTALPTGFSVLSPQGTLGEQLFVRAVAHHHPKMRRN